MNSHGEKAEEILERVSRSRYHVTVAEAQVHAILALVEELKLRHAEGGEVMSDSAIEPMSPRPENATAIWLSTDRIMAFYLDGEILKRRSSNDGGTTWSDTTVVHEGVTGFSVRYDPYERRIKGLTWRDFETDETLGLIDIRVPKDGTP